MMVVDDDWPSSRTDAGLQENSSTVRGKRRD